MQLVVCEQRGSAVEILRQHLDRKIRPRLLLRAYAIQGLLIGEAVELLSAVGKELVQHVGDAFLTFWSLGLGAVVDMAVDRNGVAYSLGLHDQCDAVRERADDGRERGPW